MQHISEGFLEGLVDWLGYNCKINIKIAQRGETPMPGTVYFAKDDFHLEINQSGRFIMTKKPPLRGHRPSVSITFSSVAKYYRDSALGVILTGMGNDGVEGIKDISKAGGITIAQDEKTSIVFGMPKQAIISGAVQYILPLEEIPIKLLKAIKK